MSMNAKQYSDELVKKIWEAKHAAPDASMLMTQENLAEIIRAAVEGWSDTMALVLTRLTHGDHP